jgi:hypothetical protein
VLRELTKGIVVFNSIELQKQLTMIDVANSNLTRLYGTMHNRPIVLSDIEGMYEKCVLSMNADAKTIKGTKKGYLTGIMYFAPSNLSGINVCPLASRGCIAACLFAAGRGRFYTTTRQRIVKTLAYHFDTPRFVTTIKKSIRSLIVKAKNKKLIPVVRLNGTSDIAFEIKTDIIQTFANVQFYDYTKLAKRFLFNIPKNYHLTFSLSEVNESDARFVLQRKGNVAVVFRTKQIPKTFLGTKVINGDESDLRFLDKKHRIVGLFAKGRAKKDTSGFVIDANCKKAA